MNVTPRIGAVMIASLAMLTTACLPTVDFSSDAGSPPGDVALDDASILASVADGRYHYSPQFVPVSREAYPSAVAAQTSINVWVTSADYAAYARISPDQSGSGASLAPGAMVIREVLDAKGVVAKLTLMVKGPPGYNPSVGDFWFGLMQPDGTPIVDSGARMLGKVEACFGCHERRASDGYLFGVPPAHRMGPVAPGPDAGVPDLGAPPLSPRDLGGTND